MVSLGKERDVDADNADALADAPPLEIQRQEVVDFYGDPIPVAQAENGDLYVPIRPLTDFLGLASGPQRRRIARDAVLAPAVRMIRMTGADGRQRVLLCLPLDLLPGWLFGVTPGKANADIREKLHRYRAECFKVLWNAFRQNLPAALPPPTLSGAALALEIATAIQSLAQDHLALEGQVTDLAGKQGTMAEYMRGWIKQTNARLDTLEVHLNVGATISEAQAVEIAGAVKAVAQALEARGQQNTFQQVWGDFYRRYRVQAYRNLPAARYEEALTWLHSWYGELLIETAS